MPDWLPQDWTMQTAYALCAGVGVLVVVLQLAIGLLGLGHGDELDFDATDLDADAGLHVISVRTVSAFLTVFGLVGWIGSVEGWRASLTLAAATGAGASVLLLVAWLLALQKKLQQQGNVAAENAVGKVARVYLRVPGANAGTGKITVEVQGRTAEYAAFTHGPELQTGNEVRVLRMTTPGTFEVEKLP
ncbi:MAG TPA: hypothetical protein VJP77_04375 [Planctomycetota bacterium]|nr:hypothetical protein [Planctomycetota bacterium]